MFHRYIGPIFCLLLVETNIVLHFCILTHSLRPLLYLEGGAGLNATITDHIRLTPNILLGYLCSHFGMEPRSRANPCARLSNPCARLSNPCARFSNPCARIFHFSSNFSSFNYLNRAHGILNRAHGLLNRAHDLRSRAHGILNRVYGLLNRAHGLLNRAHGLPSRAHGLARLNNYFPHVTSGAPYFGAKQGQKMMP